MKRPHLTSEHDRLLALLALLPLLLAVDLLRSRNVEVDRGNAALKAGKAEEALQAYDKAAETLSKDPGVHFNRGSALYNLQRYEDAAQAFLRATEARPAPLKASAFYNLGNSFAKASKWGEAVEAYKKSLAYAPKDIKTKWNLELALRKKRDEDKQKQDNKNKDGEKQQDDKGEEAKNDPSKSGDQKSGDKEGEGDRNAEDDQKKDQEKPGEDEKKDQEQQANKDEKKPPEPGKQQQDKAEQQKEQQKEQQAKQNQGGKPPQGKDQPGKQQSADLAEMEAILDNLEKSPKALEQELARLRAFQRRPPAKDW